MRSSKHPNSFSFFFMMLLTVMLPGCKKFVEADPPVTGTNAGNVYRSDATAIAVLTGIYASMSDDNFFQLNGSITSMSFFTSMSADELTLYDPNNLSLLVFYRNELAADRIGDVFWRSVYSTIFNANAALEGISGSTSLTPAVKQQLSGEAKFIRAFCYFYLVNLFGDVPLVTTTDYQQNRLLSRTPAAQVYQQIITDLTEALEVLSDDYLHVDLHTTTVERVRPVKWAAAALLARVYLYTTDYANAEAHATSVINNTALYNLSSLNDAFLMNSTEAIWQLQPVRFEFQSNTGEGALFVLPPTGPNTFEYPVYLSDHVVSSFEPGDQRRTSWVDSVIVGADTFYYPFKYKIGLENTATQEYTMMLRLAEQYLIRAEARAYQDNIGGARDDLGAIRARAGLSNTAASDKTALLEAIMHERRVELFTEWGHRWFDLKRTNTIDAVMDAVTPTKGGTWSPHQALYPIPRSELAKDPNLVQNEGY